MADQKSRGGQKQGMEGQAKGKQQRDVRATGGAKKAGRDMAEDARRGKQGQAGGYHEGGKRRSGE